MNNTTPNPIPMRHLILKTVFVLALLGVILFITLQYSKKENPSNTDTFTNNIITLTPEEIAEKENQLKNWNNRVVTLTPEEIAEKEALLRQPLNQ